MGVLLALHKKSTDIKGKVVITGLNPTVRRAFRIMRLDAVLNIADSEQNVMSKFRDSRPFTHQA
jgi:anti-anti-sigma regulatory factor